MPQLSLPAGAKQVRLTLPLPPDSRERYRATLRAVDRSDAIWQQRGLRAKRERSGAAVVVLVPARVFRDNTYLLTLSRTTAAGETEDVEEYPFRVTLERGAGPHPR